MKELHNRIEKLILRGVTNHSEIAAAFGIARSTATKYIKEIHDRWMEEGAIDEDRDKLRMKRRRQFENLFQEAMNAFDQSRSRRVESKMSWEKCENCEGLKKVEVNEEFVDCPECGGRGEIEKMVQKEVSRPGNPQYLNLARQTLVELTKLEGVHSQPPAGNVGLFVAAKGVGMEEKVTRLFDDAPADVVLQAKRVLEELELSTKGSVRVVDPKERDGNSESRSSETS